jgi:hypothetical protein
MKTQPDPVFDHMAGVTLTAIKDPMERTRFYRANRDAIGREEARVREGRALPQTFHAKATEPMRGLFIKRGGQIMRCVTAPSGGLFGTAKRQ